MNKKLFLLTTSCLFLSGCASLGIVPHKDLKAPCGPIASASSNPCGPEIPLNSKFAITEWRLHETA